MSNKNQNNNEEIMNENPYDSNSRNKSESDIQSSKSSSKSKVIELNLMENFDISKIKELNTKCVEFIFDEKSEIGLEILKKLELFIESNALESKFNFDSKLIISIMNNNPAGINTNAFSFLIKAKLICATINGVELYLIDININLKVLYLISDSK